MAGGSPFSDVRFEPQPAGLRHSGHARRADENFNIAVTATPEDDLKAILR